jgi:peptidoglycan hydrolase CwlO-like protein
MDPGTANKTISTVLAALVLAFIFGGVQVMANDKNQNRVATEHTVSIKETGRQVQELRESRIKMQGDLSLIQRDISQILEEIKKQR